MQQVLADPVDADLLGAMPLGGERGQQIELAGQVHPPPGRCVLRARHPGHSPCPWDQGDEHQRQQHRIQGNQRRSGRRDRCQTGERAHRPVGDALGPVSAALRADPGLVPAAVEELLRLHSTASFNLRVTAEPASIGGTVIPVGQVVIAWTAAANRDPAAFPQPGRLDLHRRGPDHLTLGRGAHFCIGASLARLELGIALTALVRRFPTLRFAADLGTLRWNPGPIVTGPRELPVFW